MPLISGSDNLFKLGGKMRKKTTPIYRLKIQDNLIVLEGDDFWLL